MTWIVKKKEKERDRTFFSERSWKMPHITNKVVFAVVRIFILVIQCAPFCMIRCYFVSLSFLAFTANASNVFACEGVCRLRFWLLLFLMCRIFFYVRFPAAFLVVCWSKPNAVSCIALHNLDVFPLLPNFCFSSFRFFSLTVWFVPAVCIYLRHTVQ